MSELDADAPLTRRRLGLLQLERRVQRARSLLQIVSAMMQVMRMSLIEIISMLMPLSASAPNMRAA